MRHGIGNRFYIDEVTQETVDGQTVWRVVAYEMTRDDAEEKSVLLQHIDSKHERADVREAALRDYECITGRRIERTYHVNPGLKRGTYPRELPEGLDETNAEQVLTVDIPTDITDFDAAMLENLR